MSDDTTNEKVKADRRPRPAKAGQQLLTLTQASTETGIPYCSIRDLGLRGHLPIVRLPDCRRWWIRRADLDRLIQRSVEIFHA